MASIRNKSEERILKTLLSMKNTYIKLLISFQLSNERAGFSRLKVEILETRDGTTHTLRDIVKKRRTGKILIGRN